MNITSRSFQQRSEKLRDVCFVTPYCNFKVKKRDTKKDVTAYSTGTPNIYNWRKRYTIHNRCSLELGDQSEKYTDFYSRNYKQSASERW